MAPSQRRGRWPEGGLGSRAENKRPDRTTKKAQPGLCLIYASVWERVLAEDCNQTRAAMRRERMVGDLALEFWCPPARNGRVARRAVSLRGEPIVLDEVAVALDQHFAAIVAAGVFEIADHARQVSGIDVTQAC